MDEDELEVYEGGLEVNKRLEGKKGWLKDDQRLEGGRRDLNLQQEAGTRDVVASPLESLEVLCSSAHKTPFVWCGLLVQPSDYSCHSALTTIHSVYIILNRNNRNNKKIKKTFNNNNKNSNKNNNNKRSYS